MTSKMYDILQKTAFHYLVSSQKIKFVSFHLLFLRTVHVLYLKFKVFLAFSEDETIIPEHFENVMKLKAARNLDWSRETEESKVSKIDKCVNLARECLKERRLVSCLNRCTRIISTSC
jgi:hypothetical protein